MKGMTEKEKRRKRGSRRNGLLLIPAMILLVAGLTACGNGKVVFTTGFGRDEVFKIGSEVCTKGELTLYLTNLQNRYESAYGAQVWELSLDGVTFEENVKEMALAKLAQIKAMALLADSKGVELDTGEKKRVEQAAEEYYASLTDREKELIGVSESTVEKLYGEYALAYKVYEYIIQDINPEISDDEARIITVQHILLRTYSTDSEGNKVAYSGQNKSAVYTKACEIRRQAVEDGAGFPELAERYSEDSVITCSFGKGEMDPVFEKTAFALATGEVSEVIETAAGFHIIKCISTFDRRETDANKLVIVEKRRKEVFDEEYDAFLKSLIRQLNTKLWEEITLIHDEEVTTASFFDLYKKHFPDV